MGEICKFNIISLALNFLEPQYPSELMWAECKQGLKTIHLHIPLLLNKCLEDKICTLVVCGSVTGVLKLVLIKFWFQQEEQKVVIKKSLPFWYLIFIYICLLENIT
jgi:hypothetical protein